MKFLRFKETYRKFFQRITILQNPYGPVWIIVIEIHCNNHNLDINLFFLDRTFGPFFGKRKGLPRQQMLQANDEIGERPAHVETPARPSATGSYNCL
jgi:hypothetical protein